MLNSKCSHRKRASEEMNSLETGASGTGSQRPGCSGPSPAPVSTRSPPSPPAPRNSRAPIRVFCSDSHISCPRKEGGWCFLYVPKKNQDSVNCSQLCTPEKLSLVLLILPNVILAQPFQPFTSGSLSIVYDLMPLLSGQKIGTLLQNQR